MLVSDSGGLAEPETNCPCICRYDIALLYLGQADYDLDAAVESYLSDERWEREHPMQANVKGKGKTPAQKRRKFGLSNGITGQL